MTWVRKGRIYEPDGSHAQCPTVLVMEDRLRIFFADRTPENRSFIAYADFDRLDPSVLLDDHSEPLLPLGEPGSFDEDGLMPSCVLQHDGLTYLYYSGWNEGGSVPYRNSIGLALSNDGTSFYRRYRGPLMDRSIEDPYLCVTPWVSIEPLTFRRNMWYVSGERWIEVQKQMEPVYVIKHATSLDGIRWSRSRGVCVGPMHDEEAFSNPSVVKTADGYKMFFCSRDSRDYRGGAGSYRIRCADSKDGIAWSRRVGMDGGLRVANDGWDSEMTCYPYVVEVDGRLLMFYNGNGFGKTGIGYAEWK